MKRSFFVVGFLILLSAFLPPIFGIFYRYWLEISIAIGTIGFAMILHSFLHSYYPKEKGNYKISEKIKLKYSLSSITFKAISLLTIGLTFTSVVNIVPILFNLNSVSLAVENNELANQINNYKTQIEDLTNEVTVVKNDKDALLIEIDRLNDENNNYRQRETELMRQLELQTVKVFGELPPKNFDQFVESFTFRCDGEEYEAVIDGNLFCVHLENWKTYDVELVYQGVAGLTNDPRYNILTLNSEEETYEMVW